MQTLKFSAHGYTCIMFEICREMGVSCVLRFSYFQLLEQSLLCVDDHDGHVRWPYDDTLLSSCEKTDEVLPSGFMADPLIAIYGWLKGLKVDKGERVVPSKHVVKHTLVQ